MKPHRLTGFATSARNDPYQLDADGFPKDQTTLDAIEFMEQSKSQPFFLYYAAWLVHTPFIAGARSCWKILQKVRCGFPDRSTRVVVGGTEEPVLLCDGGDV